MKFELLNINHIDFQFASVLIEPNLIHVKNLVESDSGNLIR